MPSKQDKDSAGVKLKGARPFELGCITAPSEPATRAAAFGRGLWYRYGTFGVIPDCSGAELGPF